MSNQPQFPIPKERAKLGKYVKRHLKQNNFHGSLNFYKLARATNRVMIPVVHFGPYPQPL